MTSPSTRLASCVKLARRYAAARGVRSRPLSTQRRDVDLRQLLADFHSKHSSLSHDEAREQATNELRWIREAAMHRATQAEAGDHVVERMVRQIVYEHKPLAYVLGADSILHRCSCRRVDVVANAGTQPFHPLPVDLLVRPPTLIPRPETEHWVNELTKRITAAYGDSGRPDTARKPFRILDVGTGTGCIALGLTYGLAQAWVEHPNRVQTVAVDQSEQALELARENTLRCGLLASSRADNAAAVLKQAGGVVLQKADLFSPTFSSSVSAALPPATAGPSGTRHAGHDEVTKRFDLVVSNPPYIPLRDYLSLEANVRDWEDRRALVGEAPAGALVDPAPASPGPQSQSDDGLVFYRKIVSVLHEILAMPETVGSPEEAPVVAFEVGKGQARAVAELLAEWRSPGKSHIRPALRLDPEIIADPWGVERAVFARWRPHVGDRDGHPRKEVGQAN